MRKRSGIRRSLLLDSSRKRQTSRKTRTRNKFLSFLSKLAFFKQLSKLFHFSNIVGIVLTGMTLFLIFAIFSPYYELKTISVVRNNDIIPTEVVQNISHPFIGKNMFFLRKEEIKNLLRQKFPEIQSIAITEKWPAEIEIKIEISPAKYTIFDVESANFSAITDGGIIVANTSYAGVPVLKILQYDKPLKIHTKIIDENWLKKIDIAEDFFKHEIKLPIREIKILMKARELHFITTGDAAIWLDLSQPVESQLKKLILSEGKIKLYTKKFDHIDLRIPKQIFWEWQ